MTAQPSAEDFETVERLAYTMGFGRTHDALRRVLACVQAAKVPATLSPAAVSNQRRDAEIKRLTALVEGMASALTKISRQDLSSEMEEDRAEHADFQVGYDAIIDIARASLPSTERT